MLREFQRNLLVDLYESCQIINSNSSSSKVSGQEGVLPNVYCNLPEKCAIIRSIDTESLVADNLDGETPHSQD